MPHSSSTDDTSDSRSPKHDKKRRKKEKKDKKSKKKHKHKHGSDDKEKELLKQAKKFLKEKLNSGGQDASAQPSTAAGSVALQPAAEIPEDQRITADDYFLKNAEFSSYLLEFKGLYFNELTSDETRPMFSQFVELWNSGRLPAKYYSGQVVAPMKRTTFKWQFKGGSDSASGAVGMAAFLKDEKEQHHESVQHNREAEKSERKKWKKEQEAILDELLPKASGREAQLQKKQAREAAKAREESPDRAFLPGGGDVMGGGDSFAAAKAREAKREAWKQKQQLAKAEELARRRADYEAAEADKMAQFRALVAKGPISIPKRQDPP